MTSLRFKLLFLILLANSQALAVDKVVDGGAGTDSLTINYSGISSLSNFTISESGDYVVLTDDSLNSVSYKNISSLTVGSYAYTNNTSANTFWNSSEYVICSNASFASSI